MKTLRLLAFRALAMLGTLLTSTIAVALDADVGATCPPLYTFAGADYARLGASVSGVGDFDGDGYGDFMAGAPGAPGVPGAAYVYSGVGGSLLCELQSESSGDNFGNRVSGIGDINNDGYGDVIVGTQTGAGRAYVFLGGSGPYPQTINAANADIILTGEVTGDLFGLALAGAGDVNADGFGDYIVSAFESNAGGTKAGRVYVFLGFAGPFPATIAAGTAHHILTGDDPHARFGASVAGVGDIDLDNYDDLIVGEEGDDAGGANAGAAHVFSGLTGALLHKFNGEFPNDRHGIGVSGAGDVNGDGWPDVVVGSDLYGGWTGKAYVYSGQDWTLLMDITGEAGGDRFGHFVSNAGDINGDGFDDVLLSAYINDAGGHYAGRAYVVLGGNGPYPKSLNASTADFIFTGEATEDRFGWSISSAGNINLDGTDEILVGAVDENHVGSYVYVFDCVSAEIPVSLDIKPGSCTNPLNVRTPGPGIWSIEVDQPADNLGKINPTVLGGLSSVVPVAILGSHDFEISDIDISSLTLEGVSPLRSSMDDVSTPTEGSGDCACPIDEADGLTDLILKFDKQAIVDALGVVWDREIITLTLTGALNDGTPIEGVDCVMIIGGETEPGGTEDPGLITFPNPFNPSAKIGFSLAAAGDVTLDIINITGQRVTTLVNERLDAGQHTVTWNGKTSNGTQVSSGIYFSLLKIDHALYTRKMVLLK